MADDDLQDVRSELRRLGYLGHGLERFLLQDALRPRRPARTLLLLAAKVGLMAGLVVALALAVALAAANGSLTATPFDLLPLFLHLLPPLVLATGLAFLALGGALALFLRFSRVRRIETISFTVALAVGAGAAALAAWRARDLVAEGRPWQLGLVALATPFLLYALIKVIDNGLLSLAIKLTDSAPRGRILSRSAVGVAVVAGGLVLLLPAVFAVRRKTLAAPPSLPTAPGEHVLVVGVDGVLPDEVDYLLARGELPALAHLLSSGGVLASYPRPHEPPATFWTSVATGVAGITHGVTALDSFRPLGAATPLARSGPLRGYWSWVEVPLGLAEYRPLLANRRRAWAVWELAARGGAPIAAVDWWATFPARPLPGLVVAHGAYQLLAEGAAGTVEPEARRAAVAELRSEVARGGVERMPFALAAMPGAGASALLDRALLPDRFYRQAFALGLAASPRAAALYLPGLDIAADGWPGGDVAFADLLREELQATDRLLADAAGSFATIAVVLDPGRRRSSSEGRVVLWRRSGCAAGPAAAPTAAPLSVRAEISPRAIAAGLMRALGLPQSGELPPPPAVCDWPSPPGQIASYGEPASPAAAGPEGAEYLESLRSLGYL